MKITASVDLEVSGLWWDPSIWQFVEPSTHLEVWTETRGMAGSLAQTAAAYGVGTTATGGQPSATLIYEAAARMRRSEGDRKVVLYVGDADPPGFRIEAHIRADFEHTHGVPIEWHRVALSKAEAEERGDPNAEVIPIAEMRIRLHAAIERTIGHGRIRPQGRSARNEHWSRRKRFREALEDDDGRLDPHTFAPPASGWTSSLTGKEWGDGGDVEGGGQLR